MSLDVALDRLPAQALAHYRWGHYRIWLSPEAAARSGDFAMRATAQVMGAAADWTDDQDFACFVALLHEFVHYQQDIGTGCGHWDSLARRSMLSKVLYEARNQSWYPDRPLPLPANLAQSLVDHYAEDSVFNLFRRRRPQALSALRAVIIDSPAYREGAEDCFAVDALMELDAVLAVQRVVQSMRTDEVGKAIAARNRHLYEPLKMGPSYSEPYLMLLQLFKVLLLGDREDLSDEDVTRVLDTLQVVAPAMLDIALSYPPPLYFTGPRAADRPHFEPGLRLIRIARALQSSTDKAIEDLEADFERLVRQSPEYAYPSQASLYEGWAEEFDIRANSEPIAAWRLDQCRHRLRKSHAIERRQLPNLISHDIPLLMESPAWPSARLLVTGRLLTDDGLLHETLQQVGIEMALAQWFLGGSPSGFICPHADGRWCSEATPACKAGYRDLRSVPRSSRCRVHSSLEHWAFQSE